MLILGESGTSKEVVARKLHYPRSAGGAFDAGELRVRSPATCSKANCSGLERAPSTGAITARQGPRSWPGRHAVPR